MNFKLLFLIACNICVSGCFAKSSEAETNAIKYRSKMLDKMFQKFILPLEQKTKKEICEASSEIQKTLVKKPVDLIYFTGAGADGSIRNVSLSKGVDLVWNIGSKQMAVFKYSGVGLSSASASVSGSIYSGYALSPKHCIEGAWKGTFVTASVGVPIFRFGGLALSGFSSAKRNPKNVLDVKPDFNVVGADTRAFLGASTSGVTTTAVVGDWLPDNKGTRIAYDALYAPTSFFAPALAGAGIELNLDSVRLASHCYLDAPRSKVLTDYANYIQFSDAFSVAASIIQFGDGMLASPRTLLGLSLVFVDEVVRVNSNLLKNYCN